MARIAIVGVGAIGSVIAALLEQTGQHEIVLCVRRPLAGLTVETPEGSVAVKARAFTNPADVSAADWVMVATKAYDVPAAAKWLNTLCANGAPVAVLQNGVEHRERFAPYVAPRSIVPVMVDCPVERNDPSHVHQRGVMHLKVPDDALGRQFVELFSGSKADALAVPDFLTIVWKKLCHNSAGVLSALLSKPTGIMREDAVGETALQIVRECVAVGRAEGAKLEDDVPENVLKAIRAAPPDSANSMYADRMASRPMEIDARNGVIVRLGKKHGIPTPCNQMAVAMLEVMGWN